MRQPLIELISEVFNPTKPKFRVAVPGRSRRKRETDLYVKLKKRGDLIKARFVLDVETCVAGLEVFPKPNAFYVLPRKKHGRQAEVRLCYIAQEDYQAALDYLEHARVNRVLWR